MAQAADGAVLATGLQTQDAQGLGNDHLLHLVVGRGDALEDLEALESGGTPGSLVRNHAPDGLVEDSGGGAEVERAWHHSSATWLASFVESDSPPRVGLYRVIFRR